MKKLAVTLLLLNIFVNIGANEGQKEVEYKNGKIEVIIKNVDGKQPGDLII